jgi:hypothetical protein
VIVDGNQDRRHHTGVFWARLHAARYMCTYMTTSHSYMSAGIKHHGPVRRLSTAAVEGVEIGMSCRRFRNDNQSAQYERAPRWMLARTGRKHWQWIDCSMGWRYIRLGVCSTGRSRSYDPIRQASRAGYKARGTSMINTLCNSPVVMVGSGHDCHSTTVDSRVDTIHDWQC